MQRARADVFLAQLRQHRGYVLRKGAARGKNLDAAGVERIALAIHEESGAVHGDGRLARAGPAHHGNHPRVLVADGRGLFGLDGGNHLAHVAGGGAGKQVEQHFIVDAQLRIDIIFELAVLHAVLALEAHLPADFPGRAVVAARAGHGIVIQRTHRGAPIVHQHFAMLVAQAVQADDDLLERLLPFFGKIHAGKEGRHHHALVAGGQIVREGFAHQIAIHLGGKLLKILRRKRRGLHAQFVPGVGDDHVHGLGMAFGNTRGLFYHRQQQLLHALRILLFGAKLLWIVHVRPSLAAWRADGKRRSPSYYNIFRRELQNAPFHSGKDAAARKTHARAGKKAARLSPKARAAKAAQALPSTRARP